MSSSHSSLSSTETPYKGKYKEQYQQFADYLIDQAKHFFKLPSDTQQQCFASLGEVSTAPQYYFSPTDTVRKYAEDFFSAFWADEANRTTIDKTQAKKHKKCNADIPACISFVGVEAGSSMGSQNICLISISGSGSQKNTVPWTAVSNFLKKNKAISSCRFVLVDLITEDFRELILKTLDEVVTLQSNNEVSSPKPKHPSKNCSEKGFGAAVAKIFYDRAAKSEKLKITGVVNCVFYPYLPKHFDELEKSANHVSSPSSLTAKNGNDVLKSASSNQEYLTPVIFCCANCQAYKSTMLYLMWASSNYYDSLRNTTTPSKVRQIQNIMTSPLSFKITPEQEKVKTKKKQLNFGAHNNFFKASIDEASQELSNNSPTSESKSDGEDEEKAISTGVKNLDF
ncbi:MAG TPA: hypothetical protein VHA13_06235 [Gammaproteobacteria bacterium]|nr:hypothetical protein [Gammaproteobacteria bacterium]